MPIQSFERDLSNGYYFGELLSRLQLITPEEFHANFVNNQHPHTLTANLGVLSSLVRNMGIKFDAKLAKEIMNATAGASLRLCYQIKMAVQKREAQATSYNAQSSKTLQSPLKGRTSSSGFPPVAGATSPPPTSHGFQPSGLNALPPSMVSPKGHQIARPLDRVENRRLAENLLHMTHANDKQKHMAHHLQRFEKQAQEQEEKQHAAARAEEEERARTLYHAQAEAREKLAQNQAYTRSWNSGGMQEWRHNMERIERTKTDRVDWKRTVQGKVEERVKGRTEEKVHEVRSGIDEFERNLERIGANGSSSAGGDGGDDSTADQSHLTAIQHITTRLSSTLGSPAQLAAQSKEHLGRIRDKCEEDAKARKERERRRRKVLVEQTSQAAALDAKKSAELEAEKMKQESAEERAIGEEVWRTEQYAEILRANAAYREAQEAAVRDERQAQELRRHQAVYDAGKREHERQLRADLRRFEEVRLQNQEDQHEKNLLYGQSLVQRLVDVSLKTVAFREASEQALVPPQMWREWMNLFVKGLPLLPEGENAQGSEVESVASLRTSSSLAASNPTLDAGSPAAALLLESLTLGDRSAMSSSQTLTSSKDGSRTPKDASGKTLKGAALLTAQQSELDAQSLTHEAFYESLHAPRSVAHLIHVLRDTSPHASALLDAVALEDYLAGRNEWSYDIREVAPDELRNHQAGQSRPASAAAGPEGGKGIKSPKTSKKSLAAKRASGGSLTSLDGASEEKEQPPMEQVPFTSLSFLGPLHPADDVNLSEPLDLAGAPSDGSSAASAAAALPAHQNPLFGALLQRILDVASGAEVEPDRPEVPRFPLACLLLGKAFAGKKSQAALLRDKFGLAVLQVEELIQKGLKELDELEEAQKQEKLSARGRPGSSSARRASVKAAAKSPYQLALVKMKKHLAKSEPVPDDILVSLIVEAIRVLPGQVALARAARDEQTRQQRTDPETGEPWTPAQPEEDDPERPRELIPGEGGYVLVGFPQTLAQAKLLELQLSGFTLPTAPTAKSTGVPKLSAKKVGKVGSKVARAVTPPPHEGPYPSAIDLVLRLDQSNEVLLRRARGQRIDPLTGQVYHLDYAQPTEADMNASIVSHPSTGAKTSASNLKARLALPPAAADVLATLPETFLTYEAAEKDIAEWFELFGTIKVVQPTKQDGTGSSSDGHATIEDIREAIRTLVRERMVLIDERKEREEHERVERERQAAIANGEVVPPPISSVEANALAQAAASIPPPTEAELLAAAAATAASPVSPPGAKKTGVSAAAAAAAAQAGLDAEAAGPAYVYPTFTASELLSFSKCGFYDVDLSNLLSQKWQRCEENYLAYSKHVFRALRALRAQNLEYFASTRRNFFTFLRRADAKQTALDQWQQAYNQVPADLRGDQATKEELHMRLDELAEQLWRLNQVKQEENETEFARISGATNAIVPGQNEFLTHQLQSLYFYYALLMQVELDRYFLSCRIAQDFFTVAKGGVLHEEKERDPNEKKSKQDLEVRTGEPLSGPIKGGLGLKMHINLPLTMDGLRGMEPKARKALEKATSQGSIASGGSGSSASAASGKDGKKAASASALRAASSSRKRLAPADLASQLVVEDPFAEMAEILRANFLSPEEALDQINQGQDLDSLVASAGASTARGKKPGTSAGAKKSASAAAPASPGPARSLSAKKRAAAKLAGAAGGFGAAGDEKRVKPPSRDALLDVQLRSLLQNENRLLSTRIRRIHRNALLEMAQLKLYTHSVFLDRLDRYLELRIKGESGAIDSLVYHVQTQAIEAGEAAPRAPEAGRGELLHRRRHPEPA